VSPGKFRLGRLGLCADRLLACGDRARMGQPLGIMPAPSHLYASDGIGGPLRRVG